MALVCLLCAHRAGQAQAAPDLRIESFGPAQSVSVGLDTVTLVATIRNAGATPLAQGGATARLMPLAGLEYVEGGTVSSLPALDPAGTVTYRWRLRPTEASGPMVASVAVTVPGARPVVRVVGIPRFAERPPGEPATTSLFPVARTWTGGGSVENGRMRARIFLTHGTLPVAIIAARDGSGWRRAATVVKLAEVMSAEGGQAPWWETFRAERIRAVNGPRESSLILSGHVGLRWRATVTVVARLGSNALEVQFGGAPLRQLQLHGLRVAALAAGDGGLGPQTCDELTDDESQGRTVAALRWGNLTLATVRPSAPPFAGWRMARMPELTGAGYRVLGWEALPVASGAVLGAGALVESRVRVVAICPSFTAADARRLGMSDPAPPPALLRDALRRASGQAEASRAASTRGQGSAGASSSRSSARRSRAPRVRPRASLDGSGGLPGSFGGSVLQWVQG
ncbi:MAG TPA: hypothetical protein VLH79_01455 [Chthonomonadales bacterium]|nr:hypothetical protein [Chthonomonadales bacterium]